MVAPRGSIEFFKKMKLKPAQKDLLDRVTTLTDDEIENCGQPAWIRKHLRTLRDLNGLTPAEHVSRIANQMQANHVDRPPPSFPVFEWISPEENIKPDGRGFDLDIRTGDLFLADPGANQMKIDYSVLPIRSARIQTYTSRSRFVGMMTDRDYIEELGRRKQRT